ncbi:PaaI family thioesterase [Faecalicatena contorta]|uniref:PaaI family thioesterase n=1 Tax=Faecalicatena contorta TaxID=39482 RepID=UPI001F47DDCB|nr:PaaI family thioesterase [Faecalicatena contorta]MCF2555790.1 PaaI family thioesterase [Faecalicatena contorta]
MVDYERLLEHRNAVNKYASFMGIVTTEIKEGYARAEMQIRPEHENAVGTVHGGAIFSLADTSAGAAAASYGTKMTTVSSDFHYLSPAMGTERLYGEAKAIKHGKKMSTLEVEIFSDDKKLIAKGTFTYFNLGVPLFED